MYFDVVNVQPCFNFSYKIIILNLEYHYAEACFINTGKIVQIMDDVLSIIFDFP